MIYIYLYIIYRNLQINIQILSDKQWNIIMVVDENLLFVVVEINYTKEKRYYILFFLPNLSLSGFLRLPIV